MQQEKNYQPPLKGLEDRPEITARGMCPFYHELIVDGVTHKKAHKVTNRHFSQKKSYMDLKNSYELWLLTKSHSMQMIVRDWSIKGMKGVFNEK